MFPIKWIAWLVTATACLILPVAHARNHVSSFINADDNFQALRDAAYHDDAASASVYASRLATYSIPSYVDYFRLRPRLRVASELELRSFLTRYQNTAIADRLRNDWLLELGHARNWTEFDEQYAQFVLDDDLQVKCYALTSRAIKGQNVVEDARAVLLSPKDYGDACRGLIETLLQTRQFTVNDVWDQIRLAAETGATVPAQRIGTLIDVPEKRIAQAIDRSAIMLAKDVGKGRVAHELTIIALGRMAKISPDLATHALAGFAKNLTPQEQALAWTQIALQTSLKLAPEALEYWGKVADAPLSNEGYQWRVRMAMRAGDWKLVRSSIEAMPSNLRSNPTWIYWMGRALKAEGKSEEAQKMFRSIADEVHFYGQLAVEELGQKITVPPAALAPTPEEISAVSSNAGLQRAIKFFELNMRFEGVREWNWELRKMSEREHLAAAEFARQNNLLDRMVSTSDRTKSERDFTQRFPSPFRDFMYDTTKTLGLDMAWVYGLIRQESRFTMKAKSQVGASGLMQLMPATAYYVARKIGLVSYNKTQVNDVNTNIQLGTNYMNMVLKDLDGSQALASAAYNAGPGRPRAWRATLTLPVEGAVFAESIPFPETRGYVKNVLSNATYYAALFEGKPQSLRERLGMVAPKGFVASELP